MSGPSNARAEVERLAFSVPEVAEMLGISRASAYAYVRDGLIRAVVLRGRIVVPRRVLDELLDIEKAG
jgi:excisionase family DNA binding protein